MSRVSIILGISAFYHDSAAALIIDGDIVSAAQEERFTRVKNDPAFPINAIKFVLNDNGLNLSDVEAISFYDKPFIKFERLLETFHVFAPFGLRSFLQAIPVWVKQKLFIKKLIYDELKKLHSCSPKIFFSEHHLSHAASAFYPSPFDEAAILTIDGVGEWATTTIGYGKNNQISILNELKFPHSLGLLYSAFTYYCGFKVNSGEYKLMGLAPYGDSESDQTKEFKAKITTHLIDIKEDGSFLLNMSFFNFATGLTMTKDEKWERLFGIKRRKLETELSQDIMNLALAIQQVTEDIVLKLAHTAKKITNSSYLVMAGGVALNCVANGKLLKSKLFKEIWIQPASGDAGGALGAALSVWYITKKKLRIINKDNSDFMHGSYLGPKYSNTAIEKILKKLDSKYVFYENYDEICSKISNCLDDGKVVGWFQGAMEFGPRALCNRSILGDPRKANMQKKLNLKIKFRESFRPFAPVILEEKCQYFFDLKQASPYMLLVASVLNLHRTIEKENFNLLDMYERLYHCKSDVPAITHVDYSARVQTINKNTNNRMYKLLDAFDKKTGCPLLVNTSFNVRGEPIVCTPLDAYNCFLNTEMDVLVLNDFVIEKKHQNIKYVKEKK